MNLDEVRRDERALSMGLFGFIAIIVITALLYTMLNPAIADVFAFSSEQATTTQAQDAIDRRQQIWGYMPMFGVFLAAIYLLSRAVFESRRPG